MDRFTVGNMGGSPRQHKHAVGEVNRLFNIVRDERTNINGVLNSIKDGRIGGKLWFANPHGFIVGAGGTVNVGSLTVSTPTQQFVENFFLSPGNPDAGAVSSLLGGTAPRNASGAISIQGVTTPKASP